MTHPGERAFNIALALDEEGNAILGGKPDETISGSIGRAAAKGDWLAEHVEEPALDAVVKAVSGQEHHCEQTAADEAARATALKAAGLS